MLHIRVRFFSTLFRFATDVAIGNRRFQCVPTPLRLLHFPCKQPRFGFSFFKQFGLGLICTTSGAGWMVGSGLTHSYTKKIVHMWIFVCVVHTYGLSVAHLRYFAAFYCHCVVSLLISDYILTVILLAGEALRRPFAFSLFDFSSIRFRWLVVVWRTSDGSIWMLDFEFYSVLAWFDCVYWSFFSFV